MKRTFLLILGLVLIMVALQPTPPVRAVDTPPEIPCSWWGYLTAEKPVTVTFNGFTYTAIYGSWQGKTTYAITVAGNRTLNGTPVYFYCNGKLCGKSTWWQGSNSQLDLRLIFQRTPAPASVSR